MTEPLELRLLSGTFAVCRLGPEAPLPNWVSGEITCVARTSAELSIVCEAAQVPETVLSNGPWRCLEVAGPLDFGQVGILSSLSQTLARAGISIFVFSTFDTDYLLIREERLDQSLAALAAAGHGVVS